MMQFEFDGKLYRVEFRREHKQIETYVGKKARLVKSKHPYTTAVLLLPKPGAASIEVAKGIVGCAPNDRYSTDVGRKLALRALGNNLEKVGIAKQTAKELRRAIWDSYALRGKAVVKVTTPELLALPPIGGTTVSVH